MTVDAKHAGNMPHNHSFGILARHKGILIALLLLGVGLPSTILATTSGNQPSIKSRLDSINKQISDKRHAALQIRKEIVRSIFSFGVDNMHITPDVAMSIVTLETERLGLLTEGAALVEKRTALQNKMPKQDHKIDVSTALQHYYEKINTGYATHVYAFFCKFDELIASAAPPKDEYATIANALSDYTSTAKRHEANRQLQALPSWQAKFMVIYYWHEKFKELDPPLQYILSWEIERFMRLFEALALVEKEAKQRDKVSTEEVSKVVKEYYHTINEKYTQLAPAFLKKFSGLIKLVLAKKLRKLKYKRQADDLRIDHGIARAQEASKALQRLPWEEQLLVIYEWYQYFLTPHQTEKVEEVLNQSSPSQASAQKPTAEEASDVLVEKEKPMGVKRMPMASAEPNRGSNALGGGKVQGAAYSWLPTLLVPFMGISLLMLLLWHFRVPLKRIFLRFPLQT